MIISDNFWDLIFKKADVSVYYLNISDYFNGKEHSFL